MRVISRKTVILNIFFSTWKTQKEQVLGVLDLKHMANDYEFYGVYPVNKIDQSLWWFAKQVWQAYWYQVIFKYTNAARRLLWRHNEVSGEKTGVMSMGHLWALFDNDWLWY